MGGYSDLCTNKIKNLEENYEEPLESRVEGNNKAYRLCCILFRAIIAWYSCSTNTS